MSKNSNPPPPPQLRNTKSGWVRLENYETPSLYLWIGNPWSVPMQYQTGRAMVDVAFVIYIILFSLQGTWGIGIQSTAPLVVSCSTEADCLSQFSANSVCTSGSCVCSLCYTYTHPACTVGKWICLQRHHVKSKEDSPNADDSTTKPTKWPVRPAKTQISLGSRPVWSVSSLSAWRSVVLLATHKAQSEDSD